MKPYLAILIDSYWEAVGNRVLWALLIGWSLVLLALAPFGYISERSFRLSSADIDDRSRMIEKLAKAANGQGTKETLAVVARLDSEFVSRLKMASPDETNAGQRRIESSQIAKELNVVIEQPNLYDEAVFPTASKRLRLQPLIENLPDLPAAEMEELNRELLQLVFPLELSRPQGEQLWIGYAGFKLGDPLPVSRRQIKQFLEPILLGTIIKLGLGILAVFVAIVVTSPIIPDTFRSSSLHLLLSKPILRVWLYLAKFFGGCIFVLVNITFVLIGLYLIAGLRFEIWNNGLLLCIPLLMFVFIIFYSVSALAGLLWGNAIVCVVTCMIFWLFCFSIGFMHDAMLPQFEIFPQISRIKAVNERLLTVNERGELNVWNKQFSVWQPAIEAEVRGQARTFGPIYDEERGLMISKAFFRPPFGGLQARSRKLSVVRFPTQRASSEPHGQPKSEADSAEAATLNADLQTGVEANSESDTSSDSKDLSDVADQTPESVQNLSDARETAVWSSNPGPELPAQLFEILELEDGILAVCRGGLFKLDFEKLNLGEAAQKGLFGIKVPWLGTSTFENIAPKDYYLSENSQAAVTQDGLGLIIYSSGSLDHLILDMGKLTLAHQAKLDGDGTEAALVQMNSEFCVVARDRLPLKILDAQLKPLADVALPDEQKVRQLSWIPGTASTAIITHTGNLYSLNCSTASIESIPSEWQGECTSMNWISERELWLGVKPNGVVRFDVTNGTIERYMPKPTTFESIFRYGVKPIYTLNPKPAALDNAMSYVLSGSDTQALALLTNDLESAQLEIDIWSPIFSNLAFVTVILGISCIYVNRKEF